MLVVDYFVVVVVRPKIRLTTDSQRWPRRLALWGNYCSADISVMEAHGAAGRTFIMEQRVVPVPDQYPIIVPVPGSAQMSGWCDAAVHCTRAFSCASLPHDERAALLSPANNGKHIGGNIDGAQ